MQRQTHQQAKLLRQLMLYTSTQVWWYAASLMKSNLACHELVLGRTDEVVSGSTAANVLCIHLLAKKSVGPPTDPACRCGGTQRP